MKNTYLDAAQTAKRHNISQSLLKRLRLKGKGPKCLNLNGIFLYPVDETDDFFKGDSKNGK